MERVRLTDEEFVEMFREIIGVSAVIIHDIPKFREQIEQHGKEKEHHKAKG